LKLKTLPKGFEYARRWKDHESIVWTYEKGKKVLVVVKKVDKMEDRKLNHERLLVKS